MGEGGEVYGQNHPSTPSYTHPMFPKSRKEEGNTGFWRNVLAK